jgi:hypothetical protein
MKKKLLIFTLCFLVVLLEFKVVNATSYSDQLPGGKNYIDINNFTNNVQYLDSIDPIKVKPDTDYVISFPGEREIEEMEIYIEGVDYYLNDRVTMIPSCTPGDLLSYCTFHTLPDETAISISFIGLFMSYYFDGYGMENFQLEEGLVPTAYEPYIEPTTDTTEPTITGSAAYIKSYQTNETIDTIITEHFTVIDEIDGDISDDLMVTYDEYTGNEQIIGEYVVLLEVSDSSGNIANFSLTIIVKDEVLPYINGPDEVYVNVDSQLTISEIINDNFSWGDSYQESITMNILNDAYTENINILGSYDVDFEVVDQSLNTINHSFMVHVVDQNAPILENDSTVEVKLSNPLNTSAIIDSLIYSDNYDSKQDLILEITENTYQGNEEIVGNYYIDVTITDLSNNVLSTRILIDVVDDIAPIIQGPNNLSLSYSKTYDTSYFINLLTVSDNASIVTLDNIAVLTNTYLNNETTVGSYQMIFELTDGAGNVTSHEITIDVIDDIPPVIYVDNFMVTVSTDVTFDEQDALLLLIKQHEIIDQDYEVTILQNEYTNFKNIPGNYLYSIELKGEDGTRLQKDFVIEVIEENDSINMDVLVRNIVVYTFTLSIITYAILKSKK